MWVNSHPHCQRCCSVLVCQWAEPSWLQDWCRFGGHLKSEQWHPQTERRNYLTGYHFSMIMVMFLLLLCRTALCIVVDGKGRCPQNGETRMWQLAGCGGADYTDYQWTVIAMIHIVRVVGMYSRTYKSFTLKLGVFMIIWAIIAKFSCCYYIDSFCMPVRAQYKVNTCREVV